MKDIDVETLMTSLLDNPEMPLRFYLNDVSINQGYHVTEIKHAHIKSTDCGKHTDAWEEILIQLLDGNADSTQGFMSSSKFTNIVNSTLRSFSENSSPRLFIEFGPNNGPLQKLRIESVDCNTHEVSIHLAYEQATCKLFERWKNPGVLLENVTAEISKPGCCSGPTARCG